MVLSISMLSICVCRECVDLFRYRGHAPKNELPAFEKLRDTSVATCMIGQYGGIATDGSSQSGSCLPSGTTASTSDVSTPPLVRCHAAEAGHSFRSLEVKDNLPGMHLKRCVFNH